MGFVTTNDNEPLQTSWHDLENLPGSLEPLGIKGDLPDNEIGAAISNEDIEDGNSVPGVCGLWNLGNTCFVNSGLQCLLNNHSFVNFFLENFEADENSKDTLSAAFSKLSSKAWNGSFSVIRPSNFKEVLGKCHPQFCDFRQHDCQEFLALLLDSMHEELNIACNRSTQSVSSFEQQCQSVKSADAKMMDVEASDEDESDALKKKLNLSKLQMQDTQPLESCCSPQSSDSLSCDANAGINFQAGLEDGDKFQENTRKVENKTDAMNSSAPSKKCNIDFENNLPTADLPQENMILLSKLCRERPSKSLKRSFQENNEPFDNLVDSLKLEKNELASKLNTYQKMAGLKDLMKDTKTLNTNVLVVEETNNLFKFGSEKFPKYDRSVLRKNVDNLHPPPELESIKTLNFNLKAIKETNILNDQKASYFSSDFAEKLDDGISVIKKMKIDQMNKVALAQKASENNMLPLPACSSDAIAVNNGASFEEAHSSQLEEDIADKEWEKYLDRNQSVVVDTFQGQFRSTVECSVCNHVSITYEPFMYLAVPLPHALEKQIVVTYIPRSADHPIRYLITVHKHEKVKQLKAGLLEIMQDVDPSDVIFAEVVDKHISKVLDENSLVLGIDDVLRSVYAFETDLEIISKMEETKSLEDDASDAMMNNNMLDIEDKEQNKKESESFVTQWHSCAICLEEMADFELLIHPPCQCMLCHNCLEVSCKHYGGNTLTCPVCNVVVNPEEFVVITQMDNYKTKVRIISVPIVFRCDAIDNNSVNHLELLGHPALLQLPNHLPANLLYESVSKSVPYMATYSLYLVDGQGKNCSRCLYTQKCSGCEIARVGEVDLLPGDSLAVHFKEIPDVDFGISQNCSDHVSMEMKQQREILSLDDCIQAFSEVEVLDEHNPWYCPMCQKNQQARKSLTIWRCPDTLMVYLKRFIFHEQSSTKVDDKVIFPIEALDLSSYVPSPHSDNLMYNLQSCVCHFGGVNSGHYTSYARHSPTNDWYYFNDETSVKQVPKEENQSNAYILFYQRSRIDEPISPVGDGKASFTNNLRGKMPSLEGHEEAVCSDV